MSGFGLILKNSINFKPYEWALTRITIDIGRTIEKFIIRWINVNRELPLQIDITNSCNLNCKHCYHDHHKNKDALVYSDWLKVFDQYDQILLRMGYKPSIAICGGEPLLSPLLKPILTEIIRRYPNSKVSILTNGTLVKTLTQDLFEIFIQIKKLSFQISIDGPNQETHDLIRGHGSFQKALDGIRILQRYQISVNLLAVLSRRSSPLIQDFFRLAAENNVSAIGFTRMIAQGQGLKQIANQNDFILTPRGLKSAYIEILKMSAKYKLPSSTQSPLYHLIDSGLGRQGRFFEGLVVDYQGYILASSRSRLKLGHIYKEGLEQVLLYSPILQSIRKGKIEKCGQCIHLKVCGGDRNAAYAFSGNYLGPDPGCWI